MLTLVGRDQGRCSMFYKAKNSPHNDPAQNVSGAVAEEPCLKGCARVKLIKSVNTNITLYPKLGRLKIIAD